MVRVLQNCLEGRFDKADEAEIGKRKAQSGFGAASILYVSLAMQSTFLQSLSGYSVLHHQQIIQTFSTQSLITAAMAQGSSGTVALLIDPSTVQGMVNTETHTTVCQTVAMNNKRRSLRRQKWQYNTPTRWLGWSLQLRAWSYFDVLTFNFCIWNHKPDNSLIFEYAKFGNVNGLRCLLQKKEAFVTDLNSHNESALHVGRILRKSDSFNTSQRAVQFGQVEAVRLLLEHGADPNQISDE